MIDPNDPRHGTYRGGRLHRANGEKPCDPCRLAEARYENERQIDILHGRHRTSHPGGTMLRLQALYALGWGWQRIGDALAMTPSGACALAVRDRPYVFTTTADKVAGLYDRWSMRVPPDDRATKYALTVANRRGWVPPLDLDDDRLDDPTYRPRRRLTAVEVAELDDMGYDHAVVERCLASGERPPRRFTHREAADIVRRLVAHGHSTTAIEQVWGFKVERYELVGEGVAS